MRIVFAFGMIPSKMTNLNMQAYLFGFHAIFAALQKNIPIQALLVLKDRQDIKMQDLLRFAKTKNIEIRFTSRKTLDEYGKSHQGVVALLTEQASEPIAEISLEALIDQSLQNQRLILVLDGITDPHNLGACIRSAEAFGADGVILPKDKSASITAVVHKTSAGASQILPVVTLTNLSDGLKKLKAAGFWIVGLAGEAETSLQEIDFSAPTVLILGSEGSGLRRLTKVHCDFLACIPMQGKTESLNVSVACGIGLFEIIRQRAM